MFVYRGNSHTYVSPAMSDEQVEALAMRAEDLDQLRIYRLKLAEADPRNTTLCTHYLTMIRICSTHLENLYELLSGAEEWDTP